MLNFLSDLLFDLFVDWFGRQAYRAVRSLKRGLVRLWQFGRLEWNRRSLERTR